jgi:two-component system response regulator QseB
MHILLVEDDLDLGRALLRGLRTNGITGEWVRRTVDARHVVDDKTMDCVLLDLSLPDGAGFDLLSDWRQAGLGVPIIIITARAALEERLAGLDSGADDYLVKPFATAELASRIRAVVRRTAQQAAETWTLGDLQIEPKRHLARMGGKPLDLSPREFTLLQELVRQAGTAVSKSDLSARSKCMSTARASQNARRGA